MREHAGANEKSDLHRSLWSRLGIIKLEKNKARQGLFSEALASFAPLRETVFLAYTRFGILMIFFWIAYCTSCALL
jgi:hypothetical protein